MDGISANGRLTHDFTTVRVVTSLARDIMPAKATSLLKLDVSLTLASRSAVELTRIAAYSLAVARSLSLQHKKS